MLIVRALIWTPARELIAGLIGADGGKGLPAVAGGVNRGVGIMARGVSPLAWRTVSFGLTAAIDSHVILLTFEPGTTLFGALDGS